MLKLVFVKRCQNLCLYFQVTVATAHAVVSLVRMAEPVLCWTTPPTNVCAQKSSKVSQTSDSSIAGCNMLVKSFFFLCLLKSSRSGFPKPVSRVMGLSVCMCGFVHVCCCCCLQVTCVRSHLVHVSTTPVREVACVLPPLMVTLIVPAPPIGKEGFVKKVCWC